MGEFPFRFCFARGVTAGFGFPPRWVQDDFRPAFLAIVEVTVSIGSVAERKFVRYDPGRFGSASVNQISKVTVVGLYIGLARAHELAFAEEFAQVESNLAVLGQFIFASGILLRKDAHHAYAARGTYAVHKRVHGHIGNFMTGWIVALVTDAFAAAVSSLAVREVEDALDW